MSTRSRVARTPEWRRSYVEGLRAADGYETPALRRAVRAVEAGRLVAPAGLDAGAWEAGVTAGLREREGEDEDEGRDEGGDEGEGTEGRA